jgi:hypothetical protein
MAKASDRKGIRTEEYPCCAEERARQMASIRQNYLSFPVIKSIPCPGCSKILQIRVYEPPTDEVTAETE